MNRRLGAPIVAIFCAITAPILRTAATQDALLPHPAVSGHRPDVSEYVAIAAQIKAQLYDAPQARVRVLTTAGPPVDLMLHHGGAYSARERARLEGRIHDGAMLLLLDSHADSMDQVGLAPRPASIEEADRIEYDIASHIVPSLADGLVSEIVHVGNRRLDREGRLPAHVPRVRQVWVVRVRDQTGVEAAILLEGDRPTGAAALARMQPLLAARSRAIDDVLARVTPVVDRRPRSIGGLNLVHVRQTPVTIRTTFPEDLPDLSGASRSVVLDIDEDFFALGPQTGAPTEADRAAVWREIDQTIERLARRGMRPGSISIALSPGYTPEDEMVPVTAAVLAALERHGVSQFLRRREGEIASERHERAGPLLELRAARESVAVADGDNRRMTEALARCDGVIARYQVAAAAQQRRGRATSGFARTGNPEWPWQPSPVVVDQRELNAVGEAYALRIDLLIRRANYRQALDDLFALETHYPDAYQPVSVRQLSPGFGWIVGQGWSPRTASESAHWQMRALAGLLLHANALPRASFYGAWTEEQRTKAQGFLVDAAELGPTEAAARRRAVHDRGDTSGLDYVERMLTWLSAAHEAELAAFRARSPRP